MRNFLLIITADENDADLIDETHEIDETFDFAKLEKVSNAIKTSKQKHNWEDNVHILYKNILTEEDIEWFDELIPNGQDGIHTIKTIWLYEITSSKRLL